YVPFGRTRLWQRTRGVELPEWAAEFDAQSWAQFFLKFVAAHPAVTVITPATSNPRHMVDNLGGGIGRLPDRELQARMIEFVDALPSASEGRSGLGSAHGRRQLVTGVVGLVDQHALR